MEDQDFLAHFGSEFGMNEKKMPNLNNSTDILSSLLSVTKEKPEPKPQEVSNIKKKETDIENEH